MSANQYLADALISHQIFLQRYAGNTANEVSELLDALAEEVAAFMGSSVNATTIRNRLARLIDTSGIEQAVLASAEELAEYEVGLIESLLDSATTEEIFQTSPELIWSTVSKEPIILTSSTGVVTTTTIEGLVEIYANGLRQEILQQVQLGIIEGESIDKIQQRVTGSLASTKANRDARAMIRTVVNHTGSQARAVAYRANERILEGEDFVATLDRRTTLICISAELNSPYPVGVGPMPPLHYQCRSIRSPRIKPEFQLSGLVGERPAVGMDDQGKTDRGVVSGNTTYSGFLRRQPESFQDEVLGRERAKLWRAGKVQLDSFVDSKGGVIPLDELKDKDGQFVIPRTA